MYTVLRLTSILKLSEKEFNGLTILHNKEQIITLDEGDFHAGEASIVEFVGLKHE